MSGRTMEQVLAETRKFVNEKQASFGKRAKEEALDNPSAIPGSAHDKEVPAGAETADAEVQQGLPPGSANNNSGATEAEKLESGHATDALTAHPGVTKKPMVTADANAKEASGVKKHAQDLTSLINNYKEKTAAPKAQQPVKKAEEMCEECGEGKADCTCEKVEKGDDKAASQTSEIELTKEVLAKIACTILSTEEGMNFTEKLLQKEAGAKAARDTMAFLEKQAEEQLKVAAYHQGAADAESLIQAYAHQAAVKKASDGKRANAYLQGQAVAEQAIKQAYAKSTNSKTVKKAANQPASVDYQALGRHIAEASIKRAQAEMMGMDPAAMGGLEGEDAAMAGMTGGGAEGDISPEELEQVLTMMVQSGELGQEELAAILEQVGAAEGAEGAGEAVGALEGGAGEEAMEEGAAPEEEGMEVEAAARDIQNSFLNHLANLRAGK